MTEEEVVHLYYHTRGVRLASDIVRSVTAVPIFVVNLTKERFDKETSELRQEQQPMRRQLR